MKKKRVLVSEAPIKKNKDGVTVCIASKAVPDYYAVEYMNEEGTLVTAEFAGETAYEDATHFICMFEYNAGIDYQNSCREYFAKKRNYFAPNTENSFPVCHNIPIPPAPKLTPEQEEDFKTKIEKAFTGVKQAGKLHNVPFSEAETLKGRNHIPTTRELIAQVTASLTEVLQEKNKRYGDSALNELKIFNGKCKVGQRLDDKLARIKNSDELRKNDVCDLAGYIILTCIENGWTDFKDQID